MAAITYKELRKRFSTTELERQLTADKQGVLRDQIVHRLSEWGEETRRQKLAGLSPADYFKADKILASLRVAESVTQRTWNSLHGK